MMIAFERKGIPIDSSYERVLESLPMHPASEAWRLQNPYPTPVTLRMLLSHIGGTNDFRASGHRVGEPIPTMYQELAGLPPSNTPKAEVVRPPGVTWVYSPTGFTMLQALIEDLYRQPFAVVMNEILLGPLGLTDSSFEQPEPTNLAARTTIPYLPDGKPLPDGARVFSTEASGGLVTEHDVAREDLHLVPEGARLGPEHRGDRRIPVQRLREVDDRAPTRGYSPRVSASRPAWRTSARARSPGAAARHEPQPVFSTPARQPARPVRGRSERIQLRASSRTR